MIKEGDTIPNVTWSKYAKMNAAPAQFGVERKWRKVNSHELFKDKRVLLFGVPWVLSPESNFQLRFFEGHYNSIYMRDIQGIYGIAVQDSYAMQSWADAALAIKCDWIPDCKAEFTEKIGMLTDFSGLGLNNRSWFYTMIINNNVVEKLFVKPIKQFTINTFEEDLEAHHGETPSVIRTWIEENSKETESPDENKWFFKVPLSIDPEKQKEFDKIDFKDALETSLDEQQKWIQENIEFQNFDPNRDSIAHKELEKDKMDEDSILKGQ